MKRYKQKCFVWAFAGFWLFILQYQRNGLGEALSATNGNIVSSIKRELQIRNQTSTQQNFGISVEELASSRLRRNLTKNPFRSLMISLPNAVRTEEITFPIDGELVLVSVTLTARKIRLIDINFDKLGVQLDATLEFLTIPDATSESLYALLKLDNINATIPLEEPIDKELLGRIQLGSLLSMDKFFPCLLFPTYNIDNPIILLNWDQSLNPVDSSTARAVEILGSSAAISLIGSTTVRSLVHDSVSAYIGRSNCPQLISGSLYLDFRDFFLPPREAENLGATGKQPYGNLGHNLYSMLRELLLTDEDGSIGANSAIIWPLTASSSGNKGAIRWNDVWMLDTNNETSILAETLQELGARVQLQGFNCRIENIDILVPPTKLVQPINNKANSLENVFHFGPQPGRRLTASLTMMLSVSATNYSNYTTTDIFDISLSAESIDIFTDAIVMVPTAQLIEFPYKDLTNMHCWLALISGAFQDEKGERIESSVTFIGITIERFAAKINDLLPSAECINCTSSISSILSGTIYILQESQVMSTWTNRLELIMKEVMLSNALEDVIDNFLLHSRQFCPHRREYNESATQALDTLPWRVPDLSPASIDTIIFTALVVTQVSLILLAEITHEASSILGEDFADDLTRQPSSTESEDSRLVDWTSETSNTDPFLILVLSEFRKYLLSSGEGTEDVRINEILREFLFLDEDGVFEYDLKQQDQNLTIAFSDVAQLRIKRVQVKGFDSFLRFHLLNPISPQMFENEINMEHLSVSVDASFDSVSSTGKPQDLIINLGFKDLNISMPLYVALNEDVYDSLQLGSLLRFEDMFNCLLSVAYSIYFPRILIQVNDDIELSFEGLMPDTGDALAKSIEMMFEIMPEKINALIIFFCNILGRDILNRVLVRAINKSNCPEPNLDNLPTYADYRKMLQVDNEKGDSIYGDIFRSVKNAIDQDLFSADPMGMPKINGLILSPGTKTQSGETGTFFWPGTQWEVDLSNYLFSLFLLRSYDLRLENVHSFGSPMELLKPNATSAYRLDNTLSIGAGIDPFHYLTSILFEIEGLGPPEIVSRNAVQFNFEFNNLAVFAQMSAKLRTELLYKFRLQHVLNFNCWAQLFTTVNSTEQAIILHNFDLSFVNVGVNMTCLDCDSRALKQFPAILEKIQNVLFLLFERVADFGVLLFGEYINKGMFDKFLIQKATECSANTELFRNNSIDGRAFSSSPLSLSFDSLETLAFLFFSFTDVALYILADKYAEMFPFERDPLYAEKEFDAQRNSNLVDLNKTKNEQVRTVLDWIEGYLSLPVTDSSGSKDLIINILLSKMYSYGNTHVVINEFFYADSWTLEFTEVRFWGLDTFNEFDIFNVIGHHTSQSRLGWNTVRLELEILAKAFTGQSEEEYRFAIFIVFEDIHLSASLLTALNKNQLGNMQLGSFLQIDELVPCIFNISQSIEFTEFYATAQKVNLLQVEGFQSDEVKSAYAYFLQLLEEQYVDVLANATPAVSDMKLRSLLNDLIRSNEDSNLTCPIRAVENKKESFVDFRDLLLSEAESRVYGGSGQLPYGHGVQQMFRVFKLILEVNPHTGFSGLSSLLFGPFTRPLFPREVSNGNFLFPGDVVSLKKNISVKDFDFYVGLTISNIGIQNVGTLGKPFSILDLTRGAPYQLNNTLTLGVQKSPVHLNFSVSFDLELGEEKTIRNNFDVSVDLHSITLVFDGFLKIEDQKLMVIPFREFANVYCWLATIPSPSLNSSGVRADGSEPGASITRLFFEIEKLEANVSCTSCTSPGIKNLEKTLSSTSASKEVTNLVNDILGRATEKVGGQLAQDILDRTLYAASRRCPHSVEFDPNFKEIKYEPFQNIDSYLFSNTSSPATTDLFNVSMVVGCCCVVVLALVAKRNFRIRSNKWLENLSQQQVDLLQAKEKKRRKLESDLNKITRSMFQSLEVPYSIRYAIPGVTVLNIALFLFGHIGQGGTVDLNVNFMGQLLQMKDCYAFAIGRVLVDVWKTGNKWIAVLAFSPCIIWPYLKLLITLIAWFAPPQTLPIALRGSIFSWLQKLAKWAMVDIVVMVVSIVGFRLSIRTPRFGFIPENIDNILSIDFLVIPLGGLYSTLFAQIVSQISSHVVIYYHRRIIQLSTQRLKQRKSDNPLSASVMEASKKESSKGDVLSEESTFEEEAAIPVSDPYGDKKDRLSSHAFIDPHGDPSDKLVTKHYVNVLLVFLAMLLLTTIVMSCTFASVSFQTMGIAGAFHLQDFVDAYSVLGIVKILSSGEQTNFGNFFLSTLLVLGVLVVPIIQMIALMHLWFFNMTVRLRVWMFNFVEMLQTWDISAIYLFAILVDAWQLESASNVALNRFCSNFEESIALLVHSGLVQKDNAQCFRRVARMEDGAYIMISCIILLWILNRFIIKAVDQYFSEIEEMDLVVEEADETAKHEPVELINRFPTLFTDEFSWVLCHEFELWASEWHRPGQDDDIGRLALEELECDNWQSNDYQWHNDARYISPTAENDAEYILPTAGNIYT